jgi:predicted aldo/keto reductase-like oxidoreductase
MVDLFLGEGFSYIDTAYVYHSGMSEDMVRRCVVERHPRESFTLATKLPIPKIRSQRDNARIFNEQLENCGVEYFDYYLLHALNEHKYRKCIEHKSFEFGFEMKTQGKIKNFGFSFHDTPEVLDEILTAYPDVDFVQLQINYIDWDSPSVQSRACYEVARKHNKQIVVMEPVKGGNLANVPAGAEGLMKSARPELSVASWAVRYVASLEGVFMVLSGMSTIEQMRDNVSYMKDFQPLDDKEKEVVENVCAIMNGQIAIGCTGCAYCVDGCPKKIAIPRYFALYNSLQQDKTGNSSQFSYYENLVAHGNGRAGDCIKCRKCETICPQKLPVTKHLADVSKIFDGEAFYPSTRKK